MDIKYNNLSITNAASNGHLNIIKYLYNKNIRYDYSAIDAASINGNLDILKFLFYNKKKNGIWILYVVKMRLI